jgi:hypothetical protein
MSDIQSKETNKRRGSSQTPILGGEVLITRYTQIMTKYVQSYHDPQDEPTAESLDPYSFDFDYGEPLSKEQLKGKLDSFSTRV